MSSIINQEIYRRRESTSNDHSSVSNSVNNSKSLSSDSDEKEIISSSSSSPSCIWSTYESNTGQTLPERGANLDTIAYFKNNQHFVLASSIVDGSQSKGALHLYHGQDNLLNCKQKTSIDIRQGQINQIEILDSKFLEKSVAGFVSGIVALFDSNLSLIKQNHTATEAITGLVTSPDQTKLYCSSRDSSINTIAVENFTLEKKYEYAHFRGITGLDSWKSNPNLLISTGEDHLVLIWDLREALPATKFTSINSIGTAIKCSQTSDNLFLLGTNCGDLIAFDIRHPQGELSTQCLGIGRIHRMKAIEETNCVGIVGYSNQLSIVSNSSSSYSSDLHQNEQKIVNIESFSGQIIRDFLVVNGTIYCTGLYTNQIYSQKM